MSGVYTVQFNGVAVTAAQDLFELVAASGKPIVILGFTLSQTTELGDAAEEALSILLKSGQSTSGSGGSSPGGSAAVAGSPFPSFARMRSCRPVSRSVTPRQSCGSNS